ncbi:MAG: helix-turn-helix transcriptional regulator [Clostridia bacterium]|nr:helix-turn-helix transcriptional regulator [Clostridia bacterium]
MCGGGPRAADEVVLEVTGLQPPPGLDAPLRRARHLQFVPCLHLGSYMSITRAGLGWAPPGRVADRFRVFYEPLPATSGRSEARRDTRGTSAGRIAAPPSKGVVAAQGTDPSAGLQVLDLGNLVPALEALGDATRVAMLQLLRRGGEMFAGQVAEALRLHPSTVSRHFAQLEAAGLVRVRREGNVKYYRLERERLRAVARVLEQELG